MPRNSTNLYDSVFSRYHASSFRNMIEVHLICEWRVFPVVAGRSCGEAVAVPHSPVPVDVVHYVEVTHLIILGAPIKVNGYISGEATLLFSFCLQSH